jgi:hypothetical protein
MQYGTTTRSRNPAITKNPSSAFGGGSTGAPCAISRARQITTPIKRATTTKLMPTNERCLRLRPRTTSAPQPTQTLALSRNLRVAMRAHQRLHRRTITRPCQSTSKFLELLCVLDSNLGNQSVIGGRQGVIAFRHRTHLLNGETLQCQKQRAQIVSGDFHIV